MRFSFRSPNAQCSPGPGHCPCRRSLRPLLARRRTLTRQSSIEEDFGEPVEPGDVVRSDEPHPSPERSTPSKYGWDEPTGREDFRDAWKKSIKMPDSRAIARQAQPPPWVADGPLVCEVKLPLPSACQTNPFSFFHLFLCFGARPGHSFCWLSLVFHAFLIYEASQSFHHANDFFTLL